MSFESNPDHLNKFLRIHEVHTKIFIDKYKHWLKWCPKGEDRILDIGCRSGQLTNKFIVPILPENFSKLHLVDKSPKMLEAAKKLFADNPKVSCEILDFADCESGSSSLGTFDHIFSLFSLMWVADQQKCFERIYDLLSPGGDCFLIFVAGSLYMEIIAELTGKARWRKFIPNPDAMYPFPYRKDPDPVGSVTKMMESIGFVNINVKLEESLFVFSTIDEFLGFFKSLPNPLDKMSPKEQEDYLKQAADLAVAHNLIGDIGERKQNDTVSEIFVIYGRK
ncbi:juvenile hormone acid O-methyltransferase-like [Lutzomyia longipalpis]|uniref:juvenile hormone acid O-methyltransferase-like n=1 Tax=Lutzomyia longipalpis TaxID=7200 RepID=UPI0024834284|nr:juvenile hormone acid O-methyltransferase-like [Lutzomyia longipalpis]